MYINNPVSNCCQAQVRIIPVYKADGTIATDIALEEGENLNRCVKCGEPCDIVQLKLK